jgi:hypothetical protein
MPQALPWVSVNYVFMLRNHICVADSSNGSKGPFQKQA